MRYLCCITALTSVTLCAQTPSTTESYQTSRAATSAEVSREERRPADYRNAFGVSLYWENDGAFTKPIDHTDRWYTSGSGIAVQWQSPGTTDALATIPWIDREFDPGRPGVSYAAGMLGSLNIYTPESITDPAIRPDDRPYAGWTYAGFIAQRANREASTPVYEHFELDAGALGPMSRAGDAQKWVHRTFDEDYPRGWEYQVRDEVGVDLKYQRRWRFDLTRPERPTGPALQLIPDAGVTLGTIHTNASAGATLRFGWNIPDDFGAGSLRYADDFTRPLGPADGLARGISGYFYLRPGVRLVAHDATFGDSLWRDDNPVQQDIEPIVGDVTAGVAVTFHRHWRFGYFQTFMSPEFDGQGEWHSFGSFTLSMVHAW